MDISKIDDKLNELMKVKGAIGVGLLDWESGMTLGMKSNGEFNVELACAGNSEVIKAKMATMKSLGLDGNIKDMLITLTNQLHIISIVPDQPELAFYMALDSESANLALARNAVQNVSK